MNICLTVFVTQRFSSASVAQWHGACLVIWGSAFRIPLLLKKFKLVKLILYLIFFFFTLDSYLDEASMLQVSRVLTVSFRCDLSALRATSTQSLQVMFFRNGGPKARAVTLSKRAEGPIVIGNPYYIAILSLLLLDYYFIIVSPLFNYCTKY